MDIMLAVVIVISLAIFLLYLGNRFKIPSIVSFLLIGILLGPFGFAVIQDEANIEMFGQLGIIPLLFTIGLEFSFRKLPGAWKTINHRRYYPGLHDYCSNRRNYLLVRLGV
ncbi:MAG: cation:proton antiporter [Methanomicrobiales archaeon]|nr:cation:proton antiporter [Methanomicrobiales archaeon]